MFVIICSSDKFIKNHLFHIHMSRILNNIHIIHDTFPFLRILVKYYFSHCFMLEDKKHASGTATYNSFYNKI